MIEKTRQYASRFFSIVTFAVHAGDSLQGANRLAESLSAASKKCCNLCFQQFECATFMPSVTTLLRMELDYFMTASLRSHSELVMPIRQFKSEGNKRLRTASQTLTGPCRCLLGFSAIRSRRLYGVDLMKQEYLPI